MNAADLESFQARLVARREELTQIRKTSASERGPVELDQSRVGRLSRIDAMQSQILNAETDRRRQIELSRIASALSRIAEGTFGECGGCGEDVEPRRLDNDPSTPLCLTCARG